MAKRLYSVAFYLIIIGSIVVSAQRLKLVKQRGRGGLLGKEGGGVGRKTSESDCPIDLDFNPVCGSDGNNYLNLSELRCIARQRPGLKVKYYGTCEETLEI